MKSGIRDIFQIASRSDRHHQLMVALVSYTQVRCIAHQFGRVGGQITAIDHL